MDNITIFGYVDEDVQKTVENLQQKNVGVVIREERDFNVLRFRAAKAKSTGKDREIPACKGKGKENAYPVGANDNVLSKRTLAQRARREREKITKICSAYQSGQNSTHYATSTPIRHAIMEQGTEMTNTFQRAQLHGRKCNECGQPLPESFEPPADEPWTTEIFSCAEDTESCKSQIWGGAIG